MTWVRGLEGARAWLAAAVVAEHVVGLTTLADRHPAALLLHRAVERPGIALGRRLRSGPGVSRRSGYRGRTAPAG